MPAPFIQLNILPDIEIINTYKTDARTLPNDTYTLTGTVELILTRPIQIRQLYVQFQGQIDCLMSSADHYRIDQLSGPNTEDEIPLNKWNTIDTNELGLLDKIARKALGLSKASLSIIDKRCLLIGKAQELKQGKMCWPFSIGIDNMHVLPPSILLPHHLIQYNLSAKIKLNSLGERVKLTYWYARMNSPLRFKGAGNGHYHSGSSGMMTNNPNSLDSVMPSLSLTDTMTTTATTVTPSSPISVITVSPSSYLPMIHDSSYNGEEQQDFISSQYFNNTDLISAALIKSNHKKSYTSNKKRQLLDVTKIIQICRHSYPNIRSLHSISRIRYCGSRKDRIDYEISMSKFTCIQNKSFSFTCRFYSLCQDTKIANMDFYLEQSEVYPIRAGDYNTLYKLLPDNLVPRHRKFSRTQHDMRSYENGIDLKLSISLDLPQISAAIDTDMLKITHKLRLILRFVDSEKERNMSLSFPLAVGTVHVAAPSSLAMGTTTTLVRLDNRLTTGGHADDEAEEADAEQQHNLRMATHVRQQLDQWLFLAPGEQLDEQRQEDGYFDSLPTYLDVLIEGNPPTPFH